MGNASNLRDAKAFADAYEPSEDDHPDLHSRVVMFRRAVKGGRDRVIAVHARTLSRFVRQIGLEIPSTRSSDDGPSKAELQAEAEELGLSKSGSKAELAERIAAAKAES